MSGTRTSNQGGSDGGDQFGDFDADLRAVAFATVDVHAELVAVEQAQTFAHIADADSVVVNPREAVRRNSHTVVVNVDREPAVDCARAQADFAAFELWRKS